MIISSPDLPSLGQRLRTSIQQEALSAAPLRVARHNTAYNCGDRDRNVYFIERGYIKILAVSKTGKECLLAINTAGDVFGDLCLAGLDRTETAIAMTTTVLKRIPCERFLTRLADDGVLEDFIKYQAVRLSEQQQIITSMVTTNSEQRLAVTLLRLARKLGTPDSSSLRIQERITHEELSEMVGTTRSRVGHFMTRFRRMGLVETSSESCLIIKEQGLADYLEASLEGI